MMKKKQTQSKLTILYPAILAGLIGLVSNHVIAHGDVTPQAVNTKGLPTLKDGWLEKNPLRENKKAVEVGKSAYGSNCARCHGIDAMSGGIAPDLRYLPTADEGDEIFINRVRKGSTRNGRVYMPPFEGILEQEAMWAIRSWLDTVYVEQ